MPLVGNAYIITISIRAPARGATAVDGEPGQSQHISIRAPARGATAKIHKSCAFMLLNDSFIL